MVEYYKVVMYKPNGEEKAFAKGITPEEAIQRLITFIK